MRKSPLRSGKLTSKTSVSDLMDCKQVELLWDEEEKENIMQAYHQRRKEEQKEQKSQRKMWGRP